LGGKSDSPKDSSDKQENRTIPKDDRNSVNETSTNQEEAQREEREGRQQDSEAQYDEEADIKHNDNHKDSTPTLNRSVPFN
jgi:hypothetical protein